MKKRFIQNCIKVSRMEEVEEEGGCYLGLDFSTQQVSDSRAASYS